MLEDGDRWGWRMEDGAKKMMMAVLYLVMELPSELQSIDAG
jgi:hypothetical protein